MHYAFSCPSLPPCLRAFPLRPKIILTGRLRTRYAERAVKKLIVDTNSHPSGLIVRIVGEAGIDNISTLEGELLKISALRPPLVVFDLSGLDFIASLGMGALMSFRQ